MSKMQYVAGILGVNLLDQFQIIGKGSSLYMITDKDIVVKVDKYKWTSAPDVLYKLMTGELTIKKTLWKPRIGDSYYVPNLVYHEVARKNWCDTSLDNYMYNNGLVFRIEEEARNMLDEIISFVKIERGVDS